LIADAGNALAVCVGSGCRADDHAALVGLISRSDQWPRHDSLWRSFAIVSPIQLGGALGLQFKRTPPVQAGVQRVGVTQSIKIRESDVDYRNFKD
jgi:hypothetical protein